MMLQSFERLGGVYGGVFQVNQKEVSYTNQGKRSYVGGSKLTEIHY